MIFADPTYFLSNGGISVQSGKQVSVNKGDWDKSRGFEKDNEFNYKWLSLCREKLKENGAPDHVRGLDNLKSILNTVPTSANIKKYVRIVRDKSFERRIIKISEDVANRGYTDTGEASDLIESAESEIFKLSQAYSQANNKDQSIYNIMMNTLRSIEASAEAGGSKGNIFA